MIDINVVKEKYAGMTDEELVHFAQTDSHDLTNEALILLKDEFAKRRLDLDAVNQAETNQVMEYFVDPITGFHNFSAGSGDVLKKFNHQKNVEEQAQLQRRNALLEGNEQALTTVTEEELKKLIKKCNRTMRIGGILFIVGTVATLLGYEMAKEGKGGNSFIVFWGAIIFGGISFFVSYSNKKKYQAILFNIYTKGNS
jgi:hypothetical protein